MKPRRVVEEMCTDTSCGSADETHWHPFALGSLLEAKDGEYTLTLRVRTVQDATTHRERVLRCLGTGACLGAEEIAICEGIQLDVTRTVLSKLTERGLVRRVSRGMYALAATRMPVRRSGA